MNVDRRLLHGLDPAQVEAVLTDAQPLAIIAAAGSGKTTVLTRRIAARLAAGTADAGHVLAVTFTREAAGELQRRLRSLAIRERIEAGTLHAVALLLLRDDALARHVRPPQVAPDRMRLLREVLTELRIKVEPPAAAADIDWARARLVTSDEFSAASRHARRRPSLSPNQLTDVWRTYEQLKRRRGVVDFDDLLERAARLFGDDPGFAAAARWRFRHLFVDEAQDLNPLQHHLLECIRGSRPDICLVGDPRQAIYGWNGAEPTLLSDVTHRHPDITIVELTTNYRCSSQVLNAGQAVLAMTEQADTSRSHLGEGPQVITRTFADDAAEAAAIADEVRLQLVQRRGADLAVLARTNEQVAALDAALRSRGVTTERSAGRSLVQRLVTDIARKTREQMADWLSEATTGTELERRLAEEVDRYLVAAEPGGFRAWVEARRPFDEWDSPDADTVCVTTFHAAKGREWWGVWLAGVETGLVPHATAISDAQIDEEARLLYVAVTRAAQRLWVSAAQRRRDAEVAPSAWFEAIVATVDDQPRVAEVPASLRISTPDLLAELRAWRHRIARVSGVDDRVVCTDKVLRSLLDNPPVDTADIAQRLGITEAAAARLAPIPTSRG
jgi:DNA helicase-2/ATP-dependent DNA helicase PcrA